MPKLFFTTSIFLSGVIFFSIPFFALAAYNGNSSGYTWGERAGWISYETTVNYGAEVAHTYLDGYIYGEDIGYISLKRDSGTPDYGITATQIQTEVRLSGMAWGSQSGWVKFAADSSDYGNTTAANYGVKIDTTTGAFSGYAWGEDIGWINFSGACAFGTTDICAGGTYKATTTFSFYSIPDAPTPVSPAEAAVVTDNTPTLYVNYSDSQSSGYINYRIVATSQSDCLSGSNIIVSGSSAETISTSQAVSLTPAVPLGASGTYYWCTQNYNANGLYSDWTAMGSFTLQTYSGLDDNLELELNGGSEGLMLEGIEF